MFLALNVGLFVLGFVVALIRFRKPQYPELDKFESILSRLQHITRRNKPTLAINAIQEATSRDFDHEGPSQIGKESSRLLTKKEIETCFEPSSWQRLAYEEFKTTILGKDATRKTFPCIYATMGYRTDSHRYVFLKSDDPAEPRNIRLIAPALKEYLKISTTLGVNTSLVIVGAPSESSKSVEDYNNSFWNMLRGLRIRDGQNWPSDIPQDTNSEKWTFCFDGQPLFPVMLTPAHQRRWSRHMSVPVIALQPKWVLDHLLGTPEKRAIATGKVRKLLAEYDHVDISPDLTSYGQPGTSEIRQLCLMDDNETAHCPYQDFDR